MSKRLVIAQKKSSLLLGRPCGSASCSRILHYMEWRSWGSISDWQTPYTSYPLISQLFSHIYHFKPKDLLW